MGFIQPNRIQVRLLKPDRTRSNLVDHQFPEFPPGIFWHFGRHEEALADGERYSQLPGLHRGKRKRNPSLQKTGAERGSLETDAEISFCAIGSAGGFLRMYVRKKAFQTSNPIFGLSFLRELSS